MSRLGTSNVRDNEILKATDLNNGFDCLIDNIAMSVKNLLETKQDFVVGDKNLITYHSESANDWSLNIKSLIGYCHNTGNIVLETAKTDAACSITPPQNGVARIDTIEIRSVYKQINSEQRAFIDFNTQEKNIETVYTERELKMEVQVLMNSNESVIAPSHSEGWIKIAEVVVPGNAKKISDCTINNITADIIGLNNENWTNEKNETYNIGYISDVNSRYRIEHNADGTHQDKVIHSANLDTGVGTNQIHGNVIPCGAEISVSDSKVAATETIFNSLQAVANKITEIYNEYLKNGKYDFDRELKIRGNDTSKSESDCIKLGLNTNGTVYFNLGEKTIFNILTDGKIRVCPEYIPESESDLVNKKVTNQIYEEIGKLKNRSTHLENVVDQSEYANATLSRYSLDKTTIITAATTENIDELKRLFPIDGISCSEGSIVLVKNQDNKKENGLYQVSKTLWTRIVEYSSPKQFKFNLLQIQNGTENKNRIFYCPTDNFTNPDEFGEDDIEIVEYNGSIKALGDKIPVRDSEGHVKATASTNSDDCVTRSELVTKNGAMAKALLDYVYPVGSLYWTSKNENPGITFGVGRWTQIKDRVVLAAGDSYSNGSTGGNANITLSTEQLPQHNHYYVPSGSVNSEFTGLLSNTSELWVTTDVSVGKTWVYNGSGSEHNVVTDVTSMLEYHNHQVIPSGTVKSNFTGVPAVTNPSGSSASVNIMNPYIVKYCWERVE